MRSILRSCYFFLIKVFFRKNYETIGTAGHITFRSFFFQKILGFNRKAYWPVHFTSLVTNANNIKIGIGTAPGLSPGCYIQGGGKIYLGNYSIVAPNVGIISGNHDLYDNSKHINKEVKIGEYCWLGMNSVILPGVELGDFTVVGAGAVVTKSFPEGYCVIGGNPARVIKQLDKDKCKRYENKHKYYGYIKEEKFEEFRKKKLNV